MGGIRGAAEFSTLHTVKSTFTRGPKGAANPAQVSQDLRVCLLPASLPLPKWTPQPQSLPPSTSASSSSSSSCVCFAFRIGCVSIIPGTTTVRARRSSLNASRSASDLCMESEKDNEPKSTELEAWALPQQYERHWAKMGSYPSSFSIFRKSVIGTTY